MGGAHQNCTKANNDSVSWPKVRCSRSRTIEYQELVFYEQRFSNHGPSATRSQQPGNRYNKVYGKKDKVTYH
jgi:hypothetical protein